MEILTIEDLKKASAEEIEECKSKLGIVQDIERYLEWIGENNFTTRGEFVLEMGDRSLGVHSSTISHRGFCPLRVYYECTGELKASKAQNKVDTRMTYDIGTLLHALLQTHLKNMFGDQFKEEVRLSHKRLRMTSSTDGLFTFSFARMILEIKSIREGGSYGFEKVQMNPFPDHLRQATCYMKLANVPFATVLYICKNNSKLKEHVISFDESIWNEVESEILPVVQAAYESGPSLDPKTGSNCYQCPFVFNCPHSKRNNKRSRKDEGREAARSIRGIRR